MAKKKQKLETYKKQDLVDLVAGLQQTENLKGSALAIASHLNLTAINTALKDVEEVAQPSVEFMKLAGEMQQYDMEKDMDKIKEKEALPENAKLIKERKEQIDRVSELLQEEVEIELSKVKQSDLPLDITAKQISGIKLIIE